MSDAKRGARAGKRVQRGRAATARPDTGNAYTRIALALTPAARDLALARMLELNPQLRGAYLDDILSMLDDSDPYLPWSENWWEEHGTGLSRELGAGGHDLALNAFCAAVLVLGLMEQTYTEEPLDPQLVELTARLAHAARKDARDEIEAPEPAGAVPFSKLAAWLGPDGQLHYRTADDDVLLAECFGCDSCIHPTADHDPQTGACLRINPSVGPCPCEHPRQGSVRFKCARSNAIAQRRLSRNSTRGPSR